MDKKPKHWLQRPTWSDECCIRIFGHNGNIKVRRPKNAAFKKKYTRPTVKFGGGSIMVSTHFSFYVKIAHLQFCIQFFTRCGATSAGKVSAVWYLWMELWMPMAILSCWRKTCCHLLVKWVLEIAGSFNKMVSYISYWHLHLNLTIFFSGAPCHTAKKVMDWFEENDINVMDWPAQSPDLNPIGKNWEMIFLLCNFKYQYTIIKYLPLFVQSFRTCLGIPQEKNSWAQTQKQGWVVAICPRRMEEDPHRLH